MKAGGAAFVILAVVAVVIGFFFYVHQFSISPPWEWLFIPDCPLYALFALLVFLLGIRDSTVDFIVAVGMAKYGIWTLFIFSIFPEVYFAPIIANNTAILIIGHLLMVLGAMVFIPKKMGVRTLGIALMWFLVMDAADYLGGTAPIIPAGKEEAIALFALAETIFISVGFYSVSAFRDNPLASGARELMGW